MHTRRIKGIFCVARAWARDLSRRFVKDERGAVLVEFALILPVMLMIWVGMVVATDVLNSDKKVSVLARTLADMTTQMIVVSQTDMDSIFAATGSVLWPIVPKETGMRVTSIEIDGAGKTFVDWSVVPSDTTLKGSFAPRARCSSMDTLPAALKVPRTSIIYAEVGLTYSASVASEIVDELFVGSASDGDFKLADTLFMRPRQSTKVTFNPTGAKCGGFVS